MSLKLELESQGLDQQEHCQSNLTVGVLLRVLVLKVTGGKSSGNEIGPKLTVCDPHRPECRDYASLIEQVCIERTRESEEEIRDLARSKSTVLPGSYILWLAA